MRRSYTECNSTLPPPRGRTGVRVKQIEGAWKDVLDVLREVDRKRENGASGTRGFLQREPAELDAKPT